MAYSPTSTIENSLFIPPSTIVYYRPTSEEILETTEPNPKRAIILDTVKTFGHQSKLNYHRLLLFQKPQKSILPLKTRKNQVPLPSHSLIQSLCSCSKRTFQSKNGTN